MTHDEIAFYKALNPNDSEVKDLGEDTLRKIAREIADKVRENASIIDWTKKESVRARMMVMVRRTLKQHKYPEGKQQRAVNMVMKYAVNNLADMRDIREQKAEAGTLQEPDR